MLRNLIDEVRNRRMLALAALGVLVALALPLLFIKSAPVGAPAADTAAPAAAAQAKLPPRAARLLATTDRGTAGHASGSSQDPFLPPAAYRAAAAAAAAKGAAPAGAAAKATTSAAKGAAGTPVGTPSKPIPVVISNADGSSTKPSPSPSPSSPAAVTPSTPVSSTNTLPIAVDVRFGKHKDSRLRRSIARNQGFYIHGKLVAMFVRYSRTHHKAIFALAPGLHISGPVKCRVQDNVCRYLDLPAGSHAWLTTIIDNRTVVKRRLDVVHTVSRRARRVTRATAAATAVDGACLLRSLKAMAPGDAPLDRDACER